MPRVFVTQVPNRRDEVTQQLVPSVNIGPAREYGELVTLMPPQASFFATADMTRALREGLKGYDFKAGDCVVAIGDPSIIMTVGAILTDMGNRSFRLLKWERKITKYIPVEVHL